jgi:hypothetical protein
MKGIVCKLVGHREFSDEVLEARPWLDRDFYGHDAEDFKEPACLRCGEDLERVAA